MLYEVITYRIREKQPKNWGEFRVPLGVPEVLEEGSDVTLVTYGSCVRIAQEAIAQLKQVGIRITSYNVCYTKLLRAIVGRMFQHLCVRRSQ